MPGSNPTLLDASLLSNRLGDHQSALGWIVLGGVFNGLPTLTQVGSLEQQFVKVGAP